MSVIASSLLAPITVRIPSGMLVESFVLVPSIALEWDPELHPKDEKGQWATKGSSDATGEGKSKGPKLDEHGLPTIASPAARATAVIARAKENLPRKGESELDYFRRVGMQADTQLLHDTIKGEKGRYLEERDAWHRDVCTQLLNEAIERGATQDRQAIIMGGVTGAGKSTSLGDYADRDRYVELNPDVMKEKLVEAGLVEPPPGISPMEASFLTHEESSDMAKLLGEMAIEKGYNVVWDVSMAKPGGIIDRVDDLRAAGYGLTAVFVDVPLNQARDQAIGRYERQYEKNPNTARPIDEYMIQAQADPTGKYNSGNRATFEGVRDLFDHSVLIDNTGGNSKRHVENTTGDPLDENGRIRIRPLVASGDWDASMSAGDWDPEKHPRDERGRFGEGGEGRLSPISGKTVKQGDIAADLTLSSLPEKIQQQSIARLETTMGVTRNEAEQNLTALMESSIENGTAAEYRDWYQNAHDFAGSEAERSGFDPLVVSAITAATSPGQSWASNQTAVTAVLNTYGNRDQEIDAELAGKVNAVLDKNPDKSNPDYRVEAGMKFGDVLDGNSRAGAILIGRANGIQLRTYDNLTKAVNLANANDPNAIDGILNGPKARSFYNNIADPQGTSGDVTIDSHMMEAMVNGLGSPEGEARMANVKDNASKLTGSPSYKGAEIGMYPVGADIVRTVTANVNETHAGEPGFPMLPHQVQAAIWGEQIRRYSLLDMRAITKKYGK